MSLLEGLLECGSGDVAVIEAIDEGLIEEAIEDIRLNQLKLDMPSLFYNAVQIALGQLDISPDNVEVDSNYCCASVSILDPSKVSKRKIKQLEKLGFVVYY